MEEAALSNKPYYTLSLRCLHPTIDPAEITKRLNIEPDHAWKVGEQAKTPAGTLLDYIRNQSYWSYGTHTNGKQFSIEINQIIAYLSPHRDFIHRLVVEGGRVEIYLGLLGSINIGDTITVETLAKLTDLKVDLGIEVFPNMRRQGD
jgi:hypothetical protein